MFGIALNLPETDQTDTKKTTKNNHNVNKPINIQIYYKKTSQGQIKKIKKNKYIRRTNKT